MTTLARTDRGWRSVSVSAGFCLLAQSVLPVAALFLAGCSEADCGAGDGLRLRVGRMTYAVPDKADAVPHEAPRIPGLIKMSYREPGSGLYCQSRDVPVIDTLRFSFRLPRIDAAERGGHVAATIMQTESISPPFRPKASAIPMAAIRSAEPTSLLIDRAARSARFDLRLRLAEGATQVIPVRCMWATGSPGDEARALMACDVRIALAGGNTHEIVATPPSNDRHFIGRELLRALRQAEQFKVGT